MDYARIILGPIGIKNNAGIIGQFSVSFEWNIQSRPCPPQSPRMFTDGRMAGLQHAN